MTGQGDFSPALNQILTHALERLSILDGLTVQEVATRCVLTGRVPTFPAYSKEVVSAYQCLESELTRGIPTTRAEVIV